MNLERQQNPNTSEAEYLPAQFPLKLRLVLGARRALTAQATLSTQQSAVGAQRGTPPPHAEKGSSRVPKGKFS